MKNLDSRKAKLFESKVKRRIRELQSSFNGKNPAAVASNASENTVIMLMKKQKTYQGKTGIVEFWRSLRAEGLQEVEYKIDKIFIAPADFLIIHQSKYAKYDMVAYVFGAYNFVFKTKEEKLADPAGSYALNAGHLWTCEDELLCVNHDY